MKRKRISDLSYAFCKATHLPLSNNLGSLACTHKPQAVVRVLCAAGLTVIPSVPSKLQSAPEADIDVSIVM
jgi:hypothetical protein